MNQRSTSSKPYSSVSPTPSADKTEHPTSSFQTTTSGVGSSSSLGYSSDPGQSSSGSSAGPGQSSSGSSSLTNASPTHDEPLLNQAKTAAGHVMEQAQQTVNERFSDQKGKVAGTIENVAQAFRQTGKSLAEKNVATVPSYFENTAERVQRVSDYVRKSDTGSMVRDLEAFARREPAIFLGSALALGVAGARFLKSSARHGPVANGGVR